MTVFAWLRSACAVVGLGCLAVGLGACGSDDVPTAEELQSRMVAALRGQPGEVLHLRLVPLSGERDEVEAWLDWGGNAVRVVVWRDRGPEAVLIAGARSYSHLPALDSRPLEIPAKTMELALGLLGLSELERPDGEATVRRVTVDDADVLRVEQNGLYLSEDGGACFTRRLRLDAESYRPLAVWLKECRAETYADYGMSRVDIVGLIDREALPNDFFDPLALRAELLNSALAALRDYRVPAYWLGEQANGLRLREIRLRTTSGETEPRLRYSAGAVLGEPSVEVILASAIAPPRVGCDPPPPQGPLTPRVPLAQDARPARAPLETIVTPLGEGDYCAVPGALGELRIVLSETAVVLVGALPRDELVSLLEQLEPVGPTATIEP